MENSEDERHTLEFWNSRVEAVAKALSFTEPEIVLNGSEEW
jgi:hypothetical protein